MAQSNKKYEIILSDLNIPVQYQDTTNVCLITNNFEFGYTTNPPHGLKNAVYIVAEGYVRHYTLYAEMKTFKIDKDTVGLFIAGKLYLIKCSTRTVTPLINAIDKMITHLFKLRKFKNGTTIEYHPSVADIINCSFS